MGYPEEVEDEPPPVLIVDDPDLDRSSTRQPVHHDRSAVVRGLAELPPVPVENVDVVEGHDVQYLPSFVADLWTTQILVSGLCSMELSPDLTPSFQLYISLQICSKDAFFPVPAAFSSLHCDSCVCRGGWEREKERGGSNSVNLVH